MGQRANFEESYTGKNFQGSYIAGIYTRQNQSGLVENGYLNISKVLNVWIGIDIEINGEC
jgi:maltose phosphorylase